MFHRLNTKVRIEQSKNELGREKKDVESDFNVLLAIKQRSTAKHCGGAVAFPSRVGDGRIGILNLA